MTEEHAILCITYIFDAVPIFEVERKDVPFYSVESKLKRPLSLEQ
jgi:hypothetical protein